MRKHYLLLPLLCLFMTACAKESMDEAKPISTAATTGQYTTEDIETTESPVLEISVPEVSTTETPEQTEEAQESQATETFEETTPQEIIQETVSPDYVITAEVKQLVHSLLDKKAGGATESELALYIEQLRAMDSFQADAWSEIVSFWDMTLQDGYINYEILPDGLPDDGSMCIVVLGYHLNVDGSMLPELVGRLQTALACANKYKNSYVLVTGGGTAAANPSAKESDAMAAWLVENGLDPARLIVENRSLSSSENAILSYEILKNSYPGVSSVAIVTSDYHVTLGCQLFYEQFKIAEKLHGDKPISVISNAAYISNSTSYFSLSGQAGWMMDLFYYQ